MSEKELGERVAYLEGIVPTVQGEVKSMREEMKNMNDSLERFKESIEQRMNKSDIKITELIVKMGFSISIIIPIIVFVIEEVLKR